MEKLKVLVTGSNGFIGKNLIEKLKMYDYCEVLPFDIDCDESLLDTYCKQCSFVFHLAGVNRPENPSEFMAGNFGFTTRLLEKLKRSRNKSPICLSSSIQATQNNDYGISKKAGEDYLIQYGKENEVNTYIFRLPNVFGKWCRPNYNSAIATFCNNIANGLPIQVNDRETELTLIYIDDVIDAMTEVMCGKIKTTDSFVCIPTQHKAKLGYIVDLLYGYVDSRKNLLCPKQAKGSFEKKLYSTYLSYLPQNGFSYDLKMNIDERGSFTEILKTLEYGQVSVNISKPGITKGNHWHNTKNEKFLVVSGSGVIRFRRVDMSDVLEYYVSGERLQVVDIPCGYTHNIENLGTTDMVTIMWANEVLDKDNPDTIFLKV